MQYEQEAPAAMALYRKATEDGHTGVMKKLAVLLESGEGGQEKDVPAAAVLYRKAVERGHTEAMFNRLAA